MIKDRWPTVYDFKELETQIKEIVKNNYTIGFYSLTPKNNELFQGDIVHIEKKFLYLDNNGAYSAEDYTNYWIVLGNTCDIARNLEDIPFSNVIPILKFDDSVPERIFSGIKSFQNYKSMYVPPFSDDMNKYFIDFTKIMTISKEYLLKDVKSIKIKELTYSSWVLFHACLLRYLVRDDGRND
ncbi:hypothetical protein [Arcobacter sp. s6]|uniref:hypothetical protein n=1 Tax=Arcobacter sp. s6 TaxID=3230363 RepID=UPI0034A056B4